MTSRQSTTSHPARTGFISKAEDADLRTYQNLASKFPPYGPAEIVEKSRRFVKGRDAEVALDEADIVNSVVTGTPISGFARDGQGRVLEYEWEDDMLLLHKDAILTAYERNIFWLGDKREAPAMLAYLLDGRAIADALAGGGNLVEDFCWLDPVTASEEDIDAITNKTGAERISHLHAITENLAAQIAASRPRHILKDVIDKWKENLDDARAHFLMHMRALPTARKGRRDAARAIERGNAALEDIINHNLQFAMSRVGRTMRNNPRAQKIGVADLIGAANMGLVLAARQFNPEMGHKFSTYAAYHIDGQLLEIVSSEDGKSGIKGMTPHEQKQLATITSVKGAFERLYHREPTLSELQSLTGISRQVIEKRLSTPRISTQSIHAPMRSQRADDDAMMLADVIASDETIDSAVAAEGMVSMLQDLKEEIAALSGIQRSVLCGRCGIAPEDGHPTETKTLKQLAHENGISTNDVHAKYDEAMAVLRKRLAARGWSADALPFDDLVG